MQSNILFGTTALIYMEIRGSNGSGRATFKITFIYKRITVRDFHEFIFDPLRLGLRNYNEVTQFTPLKADNVEE